MKRPGHILRVDSVMWNFSAAEIQQGVVYQMEHLARDEREVFSNVDICACICTCDTVCVGVPAHAHMCCL